MKKLILSILLLLLVGCPTATMQDQLARIKSGDLVIGEDFDIVDLICEGEE